MHGKYIICRLHLMFLKYGTVARTIRIEVADGPMAKKWSCVSSVDVQDRDTLQVETHSIDREDATFVKIVIESGWRDFVSLHRVASKGKGSREAK